MLKNQRSNAMSMVAEDLINPLGNLCTINGERVYFLMRVIGVKCCLALQGRARCRTNRVLEFVLHVVYCIFLITLFCCYYFILADFILIFLLIIILSPLFFLLLFEIDALKPKVIRK